MSGAYLRTRIVDISFAIYAPSWLVSVRLGRVYLVYNGLNGGRPPAELWWGVWGGGGVLVVESVLTGGPDRLRPGSMVTIHSAAGRIASSFSKRLSLGTATDLVKGVGFYLTSVLISMENNSPPLLQRLPKSPPTPDPPLIYSDSSTRLA